MKIHQYSCFCKNSLANQNNALSGDATAGKENVFGESVNIKSFNNNYVPMPSYNRFNGLDSFLVHKGNIVVFGSRDEELGAIYTKLKSYFRFSRLQLFE